MVKAVDQAVRLAMMIQRECAEKLVGARNLKSLEISISLGSRAFNGLTNRLPGRNDVKRPPKFTAGEIRCQ